MAISLRFVNLPRSPLASPPRLLQKTRATGCRHRFCRFQQSLRRRWSPTRVSLLIGVNRPLRQVTRSAQRFQRFQRSLPLQRFQRFQRNRHLQRFTQTVQSQRFIRPSVTMTAQRRRGARRRRRFRRGLKVRSARRRLGRASRVDLIRKTAALYRLATAQALRHVL